MSRRVGVALAIALAGCHAGRGRPPEIDRLVQLAAEEFVENVSPAEVDLPALAAGELASAPPLVLRALEIADELARSHLQYRTDPRRHPLTRADLESPPGALSCSEFVWLVYSRAGLHLGNFHLETKELAYDRGGYAPALAKLGPTEPPLPGDLLVYEYRDQDLIRERSLVGRERAGHVVLLVSAERAIVIGSHGLESTPPGGTTGVGYRRLRKDLRTWTADRRLRAIYRLSDLAARRAPARPLKPRAPQIVQSGQGPGIALTFDACLSPSPYDQRITKVLVASRTPATLFLGARWMEREAEHTRTLATIPWLELGIQACPEAHLSGLGDDDVLSLLRQADAILYQLTGRHAELVRSPRKDADERLVQLAAELRMIAVAADTRGDPPRPLDQRTAVDFVLRSAAPGALIGLPLEEPGFDPVLALPEIIGALRTRGLALVTVGEMVRPSR